MTNFITKISNEQIKANIKRIKLYDSVFVAANVNHATISG